MGVGDASRDAGRGSDDVRRGRAPRRADARPPSARSRRELVTLTRLKTRFVGSRERDCATSGRRARRNAVSLSLSQLFAFRLHVGARAHGPEDGHGGRTGELPQGGCECSCWCRRRRPPFERRERLSGDFGRGPTRGRTGPARSVARTRAAPRRAPPRLRVRASPPPSRESLRARREARGNRLSSLSPKRAVCWPFSSSRQLSHQKSRPFVKQRSQQSGRPPFRDDVRKQRSALSALSSRAFVFFLFKFQKQLPSF